MKKRIIYLGLMAVILFTGRADCYLFELFNNADNINSGTLDPARLDHSSVAFKNELLVSTSSLDADIRGLQLFEDTASMKLNGLQLFESTASMKIDGLQMFESTASTKINALGISTQTLNSLISAKVSTMGVYSSMSLIGGASFFNFTGTAVTGLTITAGTATITLTDTGGGGGGGTVVLTTYPITLSGGNGDVFVSSLVFNSGSIGAPYEVLKSTAHIVDIRASVIQSATFTCNVGIALSTGGTNPNGKFTYIAELQIPAYQSVSSYTVVAQPIIYPDSLISGNVTVTGNQNGGGTYPKGLKINIRLWRENENN